MKTTDIIAAAKQDLFAVKRKCPEHNILRKQCSRLEKSGALKLHSKDNDTLVFTSK